MLTLAVIMNKDNTFMIYRRLHEHDTRLTDSILVIDYRYTPWFRKGGNLLWS